MKRFSAFLIAALLCAPATAQQVISSGSPSTATLGTAAISTLQATTAAIGGATIGSNALAVTGTANISGTTTMAALVTTNVSANNLTLSAIPSDAGATDSTACVSAGGSLLRGSGVAGICLGTSSMRYKQDIRPLDAGLKQVMALKPVAFRYLPEYGTSNKDLFGFVAEDVQPVMPKLVGLDGEGRPNSIDWAGIVPVLVRAIQEQQAQIEALKAKTVQR